MNTGIYLEITVLHLGDQMKYARTLGYHGPQIIWPYLLELMNTKIKSNLVVPFQIIILSLLDFRIYLRSFVCNYQVTKPTFLRRAQHYLPSSGLMPWFAILHPLHEDR